MDAVYENLHLATMVPGEPYGAIRDGAVAVRNGAIAWVGRRADRPRDASAYDCGGRWMTPGLIDPHTHLIYGGDRAREFEERLAGRSYAEIAAAGGGILSTVRATRAATIGELEDAAARRVAELRDDGVTTVEIKSGYGLDRDTELRMLRVARKLEGRCGVNVRVTYLGAHAVPPEFPSAERYLDFVCGEMLPLVASGGLADAVDAFCERIAFSRDDVARYFAAARAAGLRVKVHADQLSDGGGAALAAEFAALSADHLEYTPAAALDALARAGTVAVLLPGAFYTLRETQLPPVAALRERGIPIAIATDGNPGTSPLASLTLAMNMACTLFGLTPEEALAGATRHAARALGMHATHGVIAPGYAADLALWDVEHPAELSYAIGRRACAGVVAAGRERFTTMQSAGRTVS